MKIEIQNYITKNYYQLHKIAKKYTKDDDWASELLHECIIQLYDQKEYKGNLDDKSINYYIVRILMVNWCYPSSPFYRKHKSKITCEIDLNEIINITSESLEIEHHKLQEIIETEWTELEMYPKILFERYLVLGSLRKVSIDTKIPLNTVKRNINATKKLIKENTFKKLKD